MPAFSKDSWPANGAVRALLEYLDELHRDAGQPSMAEIGKHVGLARNTMSPFFTGKRLIGSENLSLVVEYLGGDTAKAARLWKRAMVERNAAPAPVAEPRPAQAGGGGWPYRIGAVPALVGCRQRRNVESILAQRTDEELWYRSGCAVLSGLGGVGKTQIAAALAHELWRHDELDLLVWVSATSRDNVVTTYASAARTLGMAEADPDLAAARFVTWLAEQHGRRWLVILDDVTYPEDLADLWPPAGGHTVITTRRRDHALISGRGLIDVGLFDSEESVRYLCEKLDGDERRTEGADLLAEDLGHLPLALAQAASYIADRDLTCSAYRKRLAAARRRLVDLAPDVLPDGHRNTVAATWSLSIELADKLRPAGMAKALLGLMAYLDPNAIPLRVVTAPAAIDHLAAVSGRTCDADDVSDALHNLRRLSLVTLDDGADVARVHGLVQRAAREAFSDDAALAMTQALSRALVDAWPTVERDVTLGQVLRANAAALQHNARKQIWSAGTDCRRVLFLTGRSLGNSGQVSAAAEYFRGLVATSVQELGPDDPNTLLARHWAAYLQGDAGDVQGAMSTLTALLPDQLRVLGPDHPDTLLTRHEIAYWYGKSGDLDRAVQAFTAVLDHRLRVLGADHPDTLQTRSSLAYWRGCAGDPIGASQANAELYHDRLRILGADHPKTINTRHEAAYWRGRNGDAKGAVKDFEDVLADRIRVLGPLHPDTLATRHSLAFWKGRAGHPEAALTGLAEVLADRVRVLGADHPDTLTTRHFVAYWRGHAGDPSAAVNGLTDVLQDRLRVLGPIHPDTLATLHELETWRVPADRSAPSIRSRE